MLRIITSASVGQAKKYYSEGLTREGYYSEGQELAGQWGGLAAEKLGLTGSVRKDAFSMLCDNLNPATGKRLTQHTMANRRVGYDFNFHCPKSVTLAYEWHQDERILQLFRRAVKETMQELERDAMTRVRADGKNEDRITGNLAWAEFIHFTARPVNGIPDPHLHAHCFAFNATWDDAEQKFKAAQFGNIKYDADYYQATFLSRLAAGLKELGYEIEPVGRSFEIGGISRELIEKFSRRTKVVEAKAKELGATTAAERDGLAALTREKKAKNLSKTELRPLWWQRLSSVEKEALEALKPRLQRSAEIDAVQPTNGSGLLGSKHRGFWVSAGEKLQPRSDAPEWVPGEGAKATKYDMQALDFAVKHKFYTSSVVTERDLITEALVWGYGRATIDGVKDALKEFPLTRVKKDGQTVVMTAEVILEETRIVDRCKNGKWKLPAINPSWRITDDRLNVQQKAAVFHVLGSTDSVTGFIGKAGVGKTTALREIARGIEAAGQRVMAFAPTGVASRGTLRENGFPEAETVDKLLVKPSLQAQARGAVWFVDESGLMSTRMADRLLKLAENLEARVVLVGDTGQHHSVERGDAFRLLQEFGEMDVVTIDIIQRQKGLFKLAVEQISKRKFPEAFETLVRMGAIREIFDKELRYDAIATDYVAALNAGKTALMVAPTHEECDLVTDRVRQALKENGTIGEGRQWPILRNLSWSPAEKENWRSYRPGMVARVSGHVKGFPLGSQMEVVSAREDEVIVVGADGTRRELPLREADKFNVYKRDNLEVCRGDRLRITANTKTVDRHELNNGDFHTVKGFTKTGDIILQNGWRLGKEFRHLDYGYTNTSHSAQSKTVDWILVAQSAFISRGASDAEQFYTTVSRGSEKTIIYTETLDGLRENVARVRERKLAMEIIQGESESAVTRDEARIRSADLLGKQGAEFGVEHGEVLRENVEQASKRQRGIRMAM